MRARAAIHRHTACFQKFAEQPRAEIRGIFNRQRLSEPWVVLWDVPPESEQIGSRLAIDGYRPRLASGRRRGHSIVDLVVLGEWRDVQEGPLSRSISGHDIHENHV